MNILDENVPEQQRMRLETWRIRVRQIGVHVSYKGIGDDQVILLLQALRRVTFFTLDADFDDPRLCHPSYCLVFLAVGDDAAATYVRRVLKHPALTTQAKRMGTVVRASESGVHIWRRNLAEEQLPWP
jgi:hypothetical protein